VGAKREVEQALPLRLERSGLGAEQLNTPAALLARQRNAILIVLFGLAAAGWIVLIRRAADMRMDDMSMRSMTPDLTMGSASLFFAMWVAMMVAMMFPAAAPMILMYSRNQSGRAVPTAIFTGSYLSVWIAFGAVAFALGFGVERLADRSMWVMENWARVAGGLLVVAGVYQLSPLKDVCLRHCRTPLGFIMSHWRAGNTGAVRMGLMHALYCFGCCWLLFLILVPLGVMNIAAMIVVTIVVFAEKTLPWGRGIARAAAVVLIVFGVLVVVRPELLPTVT
jgi:predicted metal-binding membrane protein